jgi:hypothetical protein
MRTDVSALYIDPRGPYPKLLADCWDEVRDAKLYAGPNPVVAHPPCGPWSSLRHLHRAGGAECFGFALDAVRRFGGVIEHPAHSRAFEAHGISPIMQVDQCDFGHPARKRTWLYIHPVDGAPPPLPWPKREPTHWCSGTHAPGQRGTVPPGIKVCSAQQRRRTPVAFAEWLIELAASARRK